MFVNQMEDEVIRTVSSGSTEDTDVGTSAQGGLTQPVGVEFVDGERFTAGSVVDDQSGQIFAPELRTGGTGGRARPRHLDLPLQLQPEVLSCQVILELPPAGEGLGADLTERGPHQGLHLLAGPVCHHDTPATAGLDLTDLISSRDFQVWLLSGHFSVF